MPSDKQEELLKNLLIIRELKSKIQGNISDEAGAYRKYTEQRRLAEKISKWSIESVLESIADQESRHSESFKKMIDELDKEESRLNKAYTHALQRKSCG